MTHEPPLNEQTATAVSEFMAGLSAEEQAIVAGSFEKLMQLDIAAQAVGAGDHAPDFTLPSACGGSSCLATLLERGPVVLSFYRGGWCPFCNLEFRALQERLPEIQALGASLIGVSPETPDNSLATAERHNLEFDVLSDVGNCVARDYGLVMTVFEEMRPLYRKWGIDLPAANGDDSYELPVPATYVIGTDGRVRAAYVDSDYTRRMEPDTIVATLRTLNK